MASQNKKKGGMADREKNVLLIIAAIAILALAWFMGYQKFNEQRVTVEASNVQLDKEVQELQRLVSQEAAMLEDTSDKRKIIGDVLEQYPAEIRTQDVIDRYDQLEKKVKGLTVATESFTMNQIFFTGGVVLEQLLQTSDISSQDTTDATGTEGEGSAASAPATADYVGYRSDSVVTFSTDYTSLKNIINFINQFDNGRMNVRTLSIASEEGSKPLRCTMTVSMYTVGGRVETEGDTGYTNPTFNGVSLEKKDIFKK